MGTQPGLTQWNTGGGMASALNTGDGRRLAGLLGPAYLWLCVAVFLPLSALAIFDGALHVGTFDAGLARRLPDGRFAPIAGAPPRRLCYTGRAHAPRAHTTLAPPSPAPPRRAAARARGLRDVIRMSRGTG